MVMTKYELCVRFEDGLRDSLRVLIVSQRERDFSALVEKAKITEEVKRAECQNQDKERDKNKRDSKPSSFAMRPKKKTPSERILEDDWACLRCESIEHRVRECPLRADQVQVASSATAQPLRVVQQLPKGCGQARGGNGMARGQSALDKGAGQAKTRQSALVYAAHHREDRDDLDVITSMFFIFDLSYTALIDIGSTQSYVACSISKNLGIPVYSTSSEVVVLSPLGQSVRVSKLYRDARLEVQGMVFLTDLMKLLFGEFDMILGMDWLVKHRVSLDCATKRVLLRTEGGNKVVQNVKDIKTVRDFLDIFPEKLLDLPPNREVEFGIELLPGTAPVSVAPYRMALKELTELRAQIQELLDRGFIHPNMSPWGAPVLFVKKKNGSMRMCINY
ncbi:uncharacterized protein LOC128042517 [Gossypium raimondii]|uniref:uncharacterized protein LOC128042517 n=1 Tax=Gossypium raimondii TaxID=29730 RepID=UPI00227BA0E4|nr:uncharacterized protein LOC128042517 [Gossypium raimondii]